MDIRLLGASEHCYLVFVVDTVNGAIFRTKASLFLSLPTYKRNECYHKPARRKNFAVKNEIHSEKSHPRPFTSKEFLFETRSLIDLQQPRHRRK